MRNLMTTTALVAVLSAPGMMLSGQAVAAASGQAVAIVTVTTLGKATASGYLASNLIGRTVYESTASDAKAIGDVEDMLLSESGQAQAVIVGVGGFLGVGKKKVAVEFNRLKMESVGNGELRVVSALTKTELEAAAAYEKHTTVDTAAKAMDKATAATAATVAATVAAVKERVSDRKTFLDGKTRLGMETLTTDKVIGARVYDSDWNDVGEISELVLKGDGKPDAAVIDVGGFLGIGEKQVALGYGSLEFYQDTSGALYVTTPYSRKELEGAVEFNVEAYKTDRARILLIPRQG